jgi:tRNA A37 threonylcarbamoyladenosine dehydratase
MNDAPFARTAYLLGPEALARLGRSRVAVFGLGGVGGAAAEALCRSGIGSLDLIDPDTVQLSNLNRQLPATRRTLGMAKTDAVRQRLQDINPELKIHAFPVFVQPDNVTSFPWEEWDAVIDAVDTVSAKLALIQQAQSHDLFIVSAMGCGNRLDPSQLCVKDLYETRTDPLARVLRHECRKRGIEKLTVVCSQEAPLQPKEIKKDEASGKVIPGSSPFVPPAAGFLMASVIVRELLNRRFSQ